jgi:hypothetical protein
VTGIPGATLSAASGTTSSPILLKTNAAALTDRRLQRRCRGRGGSFSKCVRRRAGHGDRDGAAAVHLHAQPAVCDDPGHGRTGELQRGRWTGL